MWLASGMYQLHLVRLYPRTTMILLYCLLLLAGLGVMYAVDGIRTRPARTVPFGLMLVPLLFLLASAGSATANHYMPDERQKDAGYFTWIAQMTREYDGSCPHYGQLHGCVPAERR
jgi:galactan 5-O-arabinofuranosyltransferase